MLNITQNGTNRLDMELSGKLDSEEIKTALDELVAKSENIENGKMLYEVIDFHLPSQSSFHACVQCSGLSESSIAPAVLTDKTWLKKTSEMEGTLSPGLDIKAFDRDQRAEAESWLSE